jgi:hypothetical protein
LTVFPVRHSPIALSLDTIVQKKRR